MNDADIDLILSLASGDLNGEERIDALQRINADPDLAAELALQISMIDAVQSLPGAEMSTGERSGLRASLVEQLHLEEATIPVVQVKRRMSWWQPVVGLASAAAIVFAIVVVPNMLTSGADEVALEELSTESSAQFNASGGSTEPTTTTAAAAADASATEDGVASNEAPVADSGSVGVESLDLQLFRIPTERQAEFNDLASDESSSEALIDKLAQSAFTFGDTIDSADLQACIQSLEDGLPGAALAPIGVSERNTVYLSQGDGDTIESIIEVDLDSCVVLVESP